MDNSIKLNTEQEKLIVDTVVEGLDIDEIHENLNKA
jgi:hypothetical protein